MCNFEVSRKKNVKGNKARQGETGVEKKGTWHGIKEGKTGVKKGEAGFAPTLKGKDII